MIVQPGTGFTIWLTGMQLAGKRTLARELTSRLRRLEKPVEFFDGPEWEQFLGRGPGDTKDERNALTRRAGFIARAITRAGGFAIVAQVSPYRELREQLRREIGRFVEVYVDAPVDALIKRDTTHMYQKALRGEIPNFIGITEGYEPPANPEVKYDSSVMSVDDGVAMIFEALAREGVIDPADIGLSKVPPKKEKPRGKTKVPDTILFTPDQLKLPERKPVAPKAPAALAKTPEKAPGRPAGKGPILAPVPVKVEAPAAPPKKGEAKKPEAKKAAPELKKAPEAAKKPEPKKAPEAAKKPEAKKAPEPKKPEPKKAEAAKKPEPKKAEEKKPEPKKAARPPVGGKAVKAQPKVAARTARVAKGRR